MQLKLYNTLTRQKETFEPLTPGHAGIYTCGPTVYAEAHIGNLRSYVFPDLLKKTLRALEYQVTHVINITDVGHLTSDADTGDDKMEQAARESRRTAWEIAEEYEALYWRDLERLRIDPPEHKPKATGHIPGQIALVEKLEAGGYTYPTGDGIYFDTSRFPAYGAMARLKVEGLREAARVEMGGKRNKTDFALWKLTPEGVQRQMEWDSPWGRGFPGWHIECSAMSMEILGEQFDIHTGGSDHIPVHHTNEIAQSEAVTGKPFVRYWLHGEHLVLPHREHLVLGEAERMGKSEGNVLSLQTLIDKGFEPLAYRYLVLNNHYRSYLNFTWEALQGAKNSLNKLRRMIRDEKEELKNKNSETNEDEKAAVEELIQGVLSNLCDDLNTPKVLALLWTTIRDKNLSSNIKVDLMDYANQVLSLGLFESSRRSEEFEVPLHGVEGKAYPGTISAGIKESIQLGDSVKAHVARIEEGIHEEIRKLAEERWAAREAKDYAESDRLRDLLAGQGFVVRDRKDGYDLERAEV